MARILALALTLITVPSFAAVTSVHPYAGVEAVQNQGNAILYDTSGVRNRFSYRGMDGGVFVGIGTVFFRHLWLGVEANGAASSARTPTQTIATASGSSSARLRTRYTYGLSVLPGLRMGWAMLYGRAGLLQSQFQFTQSPPPSGSNGPTDDTRAGGAIYGGGLDLRVVERVHLRGEYDRVIYRRFSTFNNRIALYDKQYRLGILLDLE